MSVNLGRLIGIPVRAHYTLWFVIILIAWSLAVGYMPRQYPGLPSLTYWIIGGASAVLLFVSVLFHELFHSFMAKRQGLPVARITLFFFGGVAEATEEPKDPDVELKMAAIGPAFSFAFALLLGGFWYLSQVLGLSVEMVAVMWYGTLINAVLGGFNSIPAFPLDGGRVFRAAVWKRTGDLLRATKIATRLGTGFAYLMIFGGFISIFFGNFFDGLWIIFLGWFLKTGSETSLRQTIIGESLSAVTAGDIMTPQVRTVEPDATVSDLVTNYLLRYKHGGFPVLENGEILGIVTMEDVKKVPKERWPDTRVRDVMAPRERLVMIRPETPAVDILAKMSKYEIGRVLVVKEARLMGIVTRSDVMHSIKVKTELGV